MDMDATIKKRPKNKKVVKRKPRDRKLDNIGVEIENIGNLGKMFS